MSCARYQSAIAAGATGPANATLCSSRSSARRRSARSSEPAADQGQRGIGPAIQNKPERTERTSDVVERLEISRREKPGTQRIALAKGKAIEIHDVRHDRRR